MPIKSQNKALYPENWKQISYDIRFNRAGNRCEVCGVKNYSVGYRDAHGNFHRTYGNAIHDLAGIGDLSYKQAIEFVNYFNEWYDERLIVIVLTVAHLDHNPENNDPKNLKAMCQRCHNRYDRKHRNETRKKSKLKQTES